MRIDGRRGVTRKVFAAACDPLPSHCIIECAGVAHDLLDRFPITTTTQRIISLIIEGNVEHRTKIEIKTEKTQQTSGDIAMPADKIDIALVAQLLRIWRLVPDQTQSREAAVFLFDRDDRLEFVCA